MYSSNDIGTHSEVFSMLGLLANHFVVSRPVTVEPYDLVIRDPRDHVWKTAQVKTAFERDDRNAIVVYAKKNDGTRYTKTEVDVFLTVYQNEVYLFDNREKSEYWATPQNIHEKWQKLDHALHR